MSEYWYPLASSTWGEEEVEAACAIVRSGRTTMGEEVAAYEREFAALFGAKHAVAVNSGSSANLLMVAAQFYRSGTKRLRAGDEVVVPKMGWATTYAPLQQHGLRLRFADVDRKLLLNYEAVEAAVTPLTKAVLVVNLLGNGPDLAALGRLCEHHHLALLEDNCEAMGLGWPGGLVGGTIGDCGSWSTFFSHHVSTMEGGIVTTNDDELYRVLLSLRSHGWTRGQPANSPHHRADPRAWEFVLPGYNVRPTEVQAAIGRAQLRKLPDFLRNRRKNAAAFREAFSDVPGVEVVEHGPLSAAFGHAFVLEPKCRASRDGLAAHLEAGGVETRRVVSGNFLRHAAAEYYQFSVAGYAPFGRRADELHDRGIMVGNHHYDCGDAILRLRDVVREYLTAHG